MTVDRQPLPHNIELEQAVLGAILLQNDVFHAVADALEARHFFEPIHAKIYETIVSLVRAGKVATPINMRTFLPDFTVGQQNASQYLATLSGEAPSIISAPGYARTIRDLADRRNLIAICETTIAAALNLRPDETAQAIGSAAVEGLAEIVTADGMHGGTIRPIGLAMADFVEHIAAVYKGRAGDDVVTTGLRDLDERTGGLARGSLVVLAGRPGMGKTTVVGTIGRNAARRGHRVAKCRVGRSWRACSPTPCSTAATG
jgi:replicative DNA helicase